MLTAERSLDGAIIVNSIAVVLLSFIFAGMLTAASGVDHKFISDKNLRYWIVIQVLSAFFAVLYPISTLLRAEDVFLTSAGCSILSAVFQVSYLLSKCGMYCFFHLRLTFASGNDKPTFCQRFLQITVALYFLLICIVAFLADDFIDDFNGKLVCGLNIKGASTFASVFLLFDIVLSSGFLYMFVKRLRDVTKQDIQPAASKQAQEEINAVIRRNYKGSVVAILSTFFFIGILVIGFALGAPEHVIMFLSSFTGFDLVINLCVMMFICNKMWFQAWSKSPYIPSVLKPTFLGREVLGSDAGKKDFGSQQNLSPSAKATEVFNSEQTLSPSPRSTEAAIGVAVADVEDPRE